MRARTTARFIFRELMGTATLAVALFWSAGRLDWWPAWAFTLLTFAWTAGTLLVILRAHPALLAERLGPRRQSKPWDMALMSVYGLLILARLIVAGLDQRFEWPGDFPGLAQALAWVVIALGYGMVVWATHTNAFFSQIVRIQTERGHTVVRNGPYRWVRHPAYAGTLAVELAAPILLDSWWALIPGFAAVMVMIVRTALEDRLLLRELPGYSGYAADVHARLLPGVW
jgi:protein-S-isoprenylcysteine O-methyltransferase Ste14